MRAVVVRETGGPEVLSYEEVPDPVPGPDELLVRVAAAGVNYVDTYHRSGAYGMPLPLTLGLEGAGEVVRAAGDFAAGDRVAWKSAPGSYAELVAVPTAEAVSVPAGLSLHTAAALMLQGLTAHYLCRGAYAVQPGDHVVVHAAAGGVGLLLTQLVRSAGGRVIATTGGGAKADLALRAGAEVVTGYDGLAAAVADATDGQGAQAVYDGVGRDTFDASLAALAVRGTMVLYGAASGPVAPFDIQRLNSEGSLFLTRPTLVHYTRDRAELLSRCADVLGAAADGTLEVRIGSEYSLADVRQAHADLEARRTTGKLLLLPVDGA